MRLQNRARVQRAIELALGWDSLMAHQKDQARRAAKIVVDELLDAPANGKAVERFLHTVDAQEESA